MPHCEVPERDPAGRPRSWLDGFAICASALCTVHCLGLPLLFALLPTIAARIDPGESFHLLMLAIAVPTSLFSLLQGWRRHRAAPVRIVSAWRIRRDRDRLVRCWDLRPVGARGGPAQTGDWHSGGAWRAALSSASTRRDPARRRGCGWRGGRSVGRKSPFVHCECIVV